MTAVFTGCKSDSDESGDVVKSASEYKADAEKEINTDNMAAELEKLEKSVDIDLKTDTE